MNRQKDHEDTNHVEKRTLYVRKKKKEIICEIDQITQKQ